MVHRLLIWIRGLDLIWTAGIILIAAGIICLYLSDKVVTGWWQATLQAFGVGFIVGGLVDVLAISGLNARAEEQRQLFAAAQRQWLNDRQAEEILKPDRLGRRTKPGGPKTL